MARLDEFLDSRLRARGGRILRVGIALLAAGWWACGPGPMAGGTIETTNGLVATVFRPDGSPETAARVYRVETQAWLDKVERGESVVRDSARSDSSGRFIFRDSAGPCGLWIQTDTLAGFFPDMTQEKLDSLFQGKLILGPSFTISGSVRDPSLPPRRLLLAGTPVSGAVDGAGSFTLSGIPAQKYFALVQLDSGGVPSYRAAGDVNVTMGGTLAAPIGTDPPRGISLEDFEDLDNRGRLGPVLGNGWWEAYSDQYAGGNSTLLSPPNAGPAAFAAAIQDAGEGHARALRVRYQLGTGGMERSYPFVYAGMDIGASHYDLSRLDSLEFWARGNGRIRVELVQNIPGLHLAAWWQVDLDSSGRAVVLLPADLQVDVWQFPVNPAASRAELLAAGLPAYAARPATFAEMEGKARAVRIVAVAGDEFWIDDLQLWGPELKDLKP